MSDSDLIVLRNIAKTYRRGEESISIFSDLNLTIPSGDFVAMMGPSGSGKTTLLNLLGGLDRPTSGTILFDGAPIEKLSENQLSAWRAANIGFIFQFHHLLPEFSALENVCVPSWIAGTSKKEATTKATALLEHLQLQDRLDHKPSELSGGEQQRVAVARAFINRPPLLFADEEGQLPLLFVE
jgi:ABC-type lipoprotein export system ATPase subunit